MKSFIMTGKKRKPVGNLHHTEATDESDKTDNFRHHPPVSIESADTTRKRERNVSPTSDGNASARNAHFKLSECSAFNKIQKFKPEMVSNIQLTSAMNASSLPLQRNAPTPFLFQYSMTPSINESTLKCVPRISPSYIYQPVSLSAATNIPNSEQELGDNSAYCYADPRIPFTDYFMNLTKLFNKGCYETSRMSQMTENKPRTNERSEIGSPLPEIDGTNYLKPEYRHGITNNISYKMSEFNLQTRDPRLTQKNGDIKLQRHTNLNLECTVPSFQETNIPQFFDRNFHHPLTTTTFPIPRVMDDSPSYFIPMIHYIGPSIQSINPDKSPAIKKYKCDVCGKAFSRSNTLVTHKRIHTGDKPFNCEICDRDFRQPGNLTRHRLTHTTVKPHVCPQCNKAFNRASNLHTHMRTHNNHKPFTCIYCGKGFCQKMDWKIHCYAHTGEKPHKCLICGKDFRLKSTLNTHMKIHTKPVKASTWNPSK